MSIKIMAEVWDHAPVKGGALLFLLALADSAGDTDRCAWPGVGELSHRARCDERSAYRHATLLQELGVIVRLEAEDRPSRYSRQGGRETTCWQITDSARWHVDTPDNLSPLTQVSPQGCSGRQGRGDVGVTRTTTTHQRESANKTLPAGRVEGSVVPMRRKKRVADGDDLEVTGRAETVAEVPASREVTVYGLAKDFQQQGQKKFPAGDTRRVANMTALRSNIKRWHDRDGIPLAEIALTIDAFWETADQMVRDDGEPWRRFITLFARMHAKGTAPDITNPDYYTDQPIKENKKWTQEEWLAEQGLGPDGQPMHSESSRS